MSTLIMKFGGSAVGNVSALSQVLSIVMHEHKRWERLLLVASALDGVTDMLLEAAHLAQVANQRGYRRISATLRTRHLALVEKLPLGKQERTALQADIDRLLFEMLDECQHVADVPADTLSPEISDRIIAVGERLSARIIAALLRQNDVRGVAVDGTDLIITDSVHGNATPLIDPTQQHITRNLLPMLERQIIPVVTGFIGSTQDGKTTTMGRGGSDYTAAILSVCTQAQEVWVWSSVDGMMSADPLTIPEARIIDELSYDEVAELAYFGARILHARMIRPIQEHHIPLRIKNVYRPQQTGTLVHDISPEQPERIKAVTSIPGIGLTGERSGSLVEIIQLVDAVLFETTGTRADVMISAQSSRRSFMCFIVPTSAGGMEAVNSVKTALRNRLDDLADSANWDIQPVSVITAIGRNLDQLLGLDARILQQLEGIQSVALAEGPSRCSLSVVIHPDNTDDALQRIHKLTLNEPT